MPPDLILAFDTSAAYCAAALLSGDQIIADALIPMEKGQSEALLPMLEQILATASHQWSDLTALAVGTGPGNFTGVRIAVATARGLALALNIPAIGVTRLEALAHGHPRPITVIEDASRDEVYMQTFTTHGPDAAHLMPANTAPITLPAAPIAHAIAHIAATRLHHENPRPTPFYLRSADAAPPSDPPPTILP